MHREYVEYSAGDSTLRGYLVYDETQKGPRPAVIVAHAWKGQNEFARQKAEELAKLGYIGFAADVYGRGQTADTVEQAHALMTPLFLDRHLLRERIKAAFSFIQENEHVDQSKVGAIGFCFGGLTAMELLRSGVEVRGVVSFHGLLGNKLGEQQAHTQAIASVIYGSLLVLHGFDDPMSNAEDMALLEKEMTEANVDWQINIYGHSEHAFTDPQAHDHTKGLLYNKQTAERAWKAMTNFFEEIFS